MRRLAKTLPVINTSLTQKVLISTTISQGIPMIQSNSSLSYQKRFFTAEKINDAETKEATFEEKSTEDNMDDVVMDKTEAPVVEEEVPVHFKTVGEGEVSGFQTETKQLLDIVACSLYTDKEVFIRELVSNASDALEKRRCLQLSHPDNYPNTSTHDTTTETTTEPLSIWLSANTTKNTLTIRDNGVGMSKTELTDFLGTIARSGSKAFIKSLNEKSEESEEKGNLGEKIIGQFGVGFYSSFMVSKSVCVYSQSAKKGEKGYLWESDGSGTYKITEVEGLPIGTQIVLNLKDTDLSFCNSSVIERIIKKYSNFIEFDMLLNGNKVNTVDAMWMKSKEDITEEDHNQFYKFISNAYDSPQFKLHYIVDAPLTIRALLYIPQSHTEKMGMGKLESGINLYCRRVLIQSKAKNVLPEWLRFVKGAIDTESLPLNISRESTQDSSMLRRLNTLMTKRICRWLEDEARRKPQQYLAFFKEFGVFLKEGVCMDQIHKADIAKLLRFQSLQAVETTTEETDETPKSPEDLISLKEYLSRMHPEQDKIYYLNAPSLDSARLSPYYEGYKEHGIEVLVLTDPIDDFVMSHLETFQKKKFQNVEGFDPEQDEGVVHKKKVQTEKDEASDKKDDSSNPAMPKMNESLNDSEVNQLVTFIMKRLTGRVGVVKATSRLKKSPAVIADHESASIRMLLKSTGQSLGPEPKYNLHLNPSHDLVKKCFHLSQSSNTSHVDTAGLLVEQVFDNALISAGLMNDPRNIVNRLTDIMLKIDIPTETTSTKSVPTETTSAESDNESKE